jgi:dihydrofolate reductase
MRKVVLYMAVSLDGYIADADGGVAWLDGDGSDTDSFSKFIETIDTVILGYKTYHQIVTELSPDDWVYHGKKSYVITHRDIESTNEIIFTNKDVCELVKELKTLDGKDIWICGGAIVANELMKLNLIDRYQLSIIPIILGDGIRLFDSQMSEIKLTLKSYTSNNGMAEVIYEPRL